MALIIMYDIPKTKNTLLVRVWRELQKLNATKVMDSVWQLEDNEINLEILKNLRNLINQGGGNAKIMKVFEFD
ncbi:MAG: hypothetical protein KQA41_03025 [Candidatus Aenigmarchaeota archaeon]|nr:hypothetical protein [Candidatus Aenigmarchaeota archaeon]MBU5689174.1 hypothetical protein [Candidatus Aenigmarchaeota archaeon]